MSCLFHSFTSSGLSHASFQSISQFECSLSKLCRCYWVSINKAKQNKKKQNPTQISSNHFWIGIPSGIFHASWIQIIPWYMNLSQKVWVCSSFTKHLRPSQRSMFILCMLWEVSHTLWCPLLKIERNHAESLRVLSLRKGNGCNKAWKCQNRDKETKQWSDREGSHKWPTEIQEEISISEKQPYFLWVIALNHIRIWPACAACQPIAVTVHIYKDSSRIRKSLSCWDFTLDINDQSITETAQRPIKLFAPAFYTLYLFHSIGPWIRIM